MTGDVRILSGLSELKRGLEALGTSQENMSREHADHSDHINRIAFCGSLFGRSFAVFWLDASSKDKLLGESILQLTVEISSRVHAQSLCSAWGMILCAAVRNIAANMGLYIYIYIILRTLTWTGTPLQKSCTLTWFGMLPQEWAGSTRRSRAGFHSEVAYT